jgi:hypothetical protein
MNKTVTIYGASDDCIEIEGDIKDEIYANDDASTKLAFSDGTVLSVNYDRDGLWKVYRLVEGSATMERFEATDPDSDEYSDRVTLTGDIQWVVGGTFMKRVK